MLAKVLSGANLGLHASPVTVEVDIASQGLPSFTIVGLADRAIEESKERVRAAIRNSGADFPARRITVNLAPADFPKEGPSFDLPIAIGILQASGQINADLATYLMAGELSLDGNLSFTHGVLMLASLCKDLGKSKLIVPKSNAEEAALIEDIEVYPFSNLEEVIKFFLGVFTVDPHPPTVISFEDRTFEHDFSEVKGQEQARRALEIAAAGSHNVLLKGPPGAGKTLLARCFPSILPELSKEEALEITKIYSISGYLEGNIITIRPFRAPHHTASYVGIIGGGNNIKPGEVSLAHRGVLFLDEFPEFARQVLEALRQPLEDRVVTISRAQGSLTFPCQFILIAAQNPCPCGFLGSLNQLSSRTKSCSCSPGEVSRYKKKISGPLLDRIDIHLDVPPVDVNKLTKDYISEDSKTIKERVNKAREIQKKRFSGLRILTNSEMNNSQIKQFCKITPEALELLKLAISQLNLSARAYHRVLKLARTVADLAQSEVISDAYVAESLTYRSNDEN